VTTLREVATGVLVATSRIDALNSVVVVGRDGGVLLIDPGWEQDELDAVAAELGRLQLTPVAGFSTHAHHDHVLWHPAWGDAPRWASSDTVRIAGAHRHELVEALGTGFRADTLELVARLTAIPGQTLPWAGAQATVIVHDAHAIGHAALWFGELGVLVAGDMLSDVELPLLGEGRSALAEYQAGLDELAPYAQIATLVIPGHGTPGLDAAARLAADRRYLDALARGTASDDPRLTNPGMAEAHATNLQTVGSTATRPGS
jgi:glyoxylase-like metal-dependent hydrolase (beta-lactamase superfamily II)